MLNRDFTVTGDPARDPSGVRLSRAAASHGGRRPTGLNGGAMRTEPNDLAVKFIAVDALRPTEQINPDAVARLKARVERLGVWTHPILVERDSLAILDGHHRYTVAKALGLGVVPSVLTSYDDPRLELSSWRSDMRFLARDVIRAAEEGTLLPPKSTRHHLRVQLPRVALDIKALKTRALDQRDAPTLRMPSRWETLSALHFEISQPLDQAKIGPSDFVIAPPEQLAPHPLLRRLLLADPAMEALLPGARCYFTLSAASGAPFDLLEADLIGLAPHLLDDRRALAVAARWALETRGAAKLEPEADAARRAALLADAFRHGAALLGGLPPAAVDLLLHGLPEGVAHPLLAATADPASAVAPAAALSWMAARLPAAARPPATERAAFLAADVAPRHGALAMPVETLLVSGGDSRLTVDPRTGLNRYGAAPRPRPEAVHFSSSTASSVTDHGFLLCDMLRRAFKAASEASGAAAPLYPVLVDALAGAFGRLLSESPAARPVDLALAPSGTDLELLTVAVALSKGGRAKTAKSDPVKGAPALTNILIAPEETGRGVVFAAKGCFFDDRAATGAPVAKGEPAWPKADIRVETVPIRAPDGAPRPRADIDADVARLARAALKQGRRVLLHTLPSSKTGLQGPTDAAVAALKEKAGGKLDVVVDACQFRATPETVGDWLARGWMVQVTGSKFLTGPPFSGALLLPKRLRKRAPRLGAMLAAAPGAGSAADWSDPWRRAMGAMPEADAAPDAAPDAGSRGAPNFGAAFRWLPALLEARMFQTLTDEMKRHAFEAFEGAVRARIAAARHLSAIAPAPTKPDAGAFDWNDTIVCFTVSGPTGPDGAAKPLSAEDAVRAFKLLNADVSELAPGLGAAESALLRRPAHIGQPVTVAADGDRPQTFLRVVLGARFFNTVGHAEPSATEAALQSEIADALRALDKLDLIAAHWPRLSRAAAGRV